MIAIRCRVCYAELSERIHKALYLIKHVKNAALSKI